MAYHHGRERFRSESRNDDTHWTMVSWTERSSEQLTPIFFLQNHKMTHRAWNERCSTFGATLKCLSAANHRLPRLTMLHGYENCRKISRQRSEISESLNQHLKRGKKCSRGQLNCLRMLLVFLILRYWKTIQHQLLINSSRETKLCHTKEIERSTEKNMKMLKLACKNGWSHHNDVYKLL